MSATPWNDDVAGDAVPQLINAHARFMRVQAGPGSGKTYGLKRRVERLLHSAGANLDAAQLLVVAFNRVIAKDLKDAIEGRLAESGITAVPTVRTVHALCLELLEGTARLLMAHEREAMLYDVLEEHRDKLAADYPTFADADQALKDHEAGYSKHDTLWQGCQRWLTRHHACLVSDLPGQALAAIRGGDLTRKYECVIVDEFQDLTSAEQELAFRLVSPSGHLLALGDSRQSIYAFRGNDREGLSRLDAWAADEGVTVLDIPIPECRRCPVEVVEAANTLMSLSSQAKMVPASGVTAELRNIVWQDPDAEAAGMAKVIADRVAAAPGARHLVMVTRRKFGFKLRAALRDLNSDLKIDLNFEEGHLEAWPVREAFLFFSLLVDPDPPTWRSWLGYMEPGDEREYKPPKRNAAAYLRFLSRCSDDITADRVRELAEEDRTANRGVGGANLWERAARFNLLRATCSLGARTADEITDFVLEDSRWLRGAFLEDEDARNDLGLLRTKLHELLAETQEDVPAIERLQRAILGLRYCVATRSPLSVAPQADVHVMTLWGSKGVTAEHVYILGLCDEALPGERRAEYPGTDADFFDEQRRLFYVSITRCTRSLTLSRAAKIKRADARSLGLAVGWGFWPTLKRCRFLRDIEAHLPDAELL